MNSFSAAVGAYAPTKLRNRIKKIGAQDIELRQKQDTGYRSEEKQFMGRW